MFSYPTISPSQERIEFKNATTDTKATMLATIPRTKGIPAKAPFVAASMTLVS